MARLTEPPPWTKNVPVKCRKIEMVDLDRLTEAQRRILWYGIKSLNPAYAQAIKTSEVELQIDAIDLMRYYEAGEKVMQEKQAEASRQGQQLGENDEP